MKMRKIMAMFLAMSMMASMAVCIHAEENTEEQVTITIGAWPDADAEPENYELFQNILERFEEQYPNITVETDTYKYSTDTFMAKAAAGQLPTLCHVPLTEAVKVGESGYVAEISEKLEELGYLDAYTDSILDLIQNDEGEVYSYCYNGYKFSLMANKSVLDEAGLLNEDGTFTAPQTWEELAEMSAIVKEKTGKAGLALPTTSNCGGWHFMSIAYSYGVEFETQNEDGSWTASFNTPEAVEALQFVKDLKWKYDALDENSFIDSAQMYLNFGSGQAAFIQAAPEDYVYDQCNKNGMSADELLILPMPEGSKQCAALTGGSLYVFPSDITEEQLDAAFKWIEFYGVGMGLDDEAYANNKEKYEQKVSEDKIVFPCAISAIWKDGEYIERMNTLLSEIANASYEQVAAYLEDTEVVGTPEPSIYCQQLYAILDGVVQAVITDENADCEQLIADAANDFQVNYLDLE